MNREKIEHNSFKNNQLAIESTQNLLTMEQSDKSKSENLNLSKEEVRHLKRKSLVEISIELRTILTKSRYTLDELRLIFIATSVADYFETSEKKSFVRKRKYRGEW